MFVLSKLLGLLLNPMLWVVVTMILAVAVKGPRRRKRLLWAALLTTLFFSNGWIVKNILSAYSAEPVPMRQGESYEAGIVLSGMAAYDAKADLSYFTQDSDRFIQTLWLYRKGHIRRIVVVGGNGDPFSKHDFREADFLAARFRDMGVPEGDIAWESDSRNTVENAKDAKRLLDSMHLKGPFVLITSAYHMPRAQWLFKGQDIPTRPFPAYLIAKPSGDALSWRSLIPSTNAMDLWRILLHELAGLLAARASVL